MRRVALLILLAVLLATFNVAANTTYESVFDVNPEFSERLISLSSLLERVPTSTAVSILRAVLKLKGVDGVSEFVTTNLFTAMWQNPEAKHAIVEKALSSLSFSPADLMSLAHEANAFAKQVNFTVDMYHRQPLVHWKFTQKRNSNASVVSFSLAPESMQQIDATLPIFKIHSLTGFPYLFTGDLHNTTIPQSVYKANLVMASVFNRLADNALLGSSSKFELLVATKSAELLIIKSLKDFIDYLKAEGFKFRGYVLQRVADFMPLQFHSKKLSQVKEIPVAVFLKTGIMVNNTGTANVNATSTSSVPDSEEIIVPAAHNQYCWEFIAPSASKTTFSVCFTTGGWFHGGTEFVPHDPFIIPRWMSGKHFDFIDDSTTSQYENMVQAISVAGTLRALLNKIATDHKLLNKGYAVVAVCTDAVSIVQLAIRGISTVYPNMMDKPLVLKELTRLLTELDASADALSPDYVADVVMAKTQLTNLKRLIEKLPVDNVQHESTACRVLNSLPSQPGNEPLLCAKRARELLLSVTIDSSNNNNNKCSALNIVPSSIIYAPYSV